MSVTVGVELDVPRCEIGSDGAIGEVIGGVQTVELEEMEKVYR